MKAGVRVVNLVVQKDLPKAGRLAGDWVASWVFQWAGVKASRKADNLVVLEAAYWVALRAVATAGYWVVSMAD